jgi:hemerythrin
MSTGMEAVDAEHQEWIRRYNEFDVAVAEGQGAEHIQQILEFMTEYAEKHFVHEEFLAGEAETSAIRLNRNEHNHFRENLQEIKDTIRQNGVSAVEVVSLKMDLEKWLVHHICDVDVQLWKKPIRL